MRLFPIFISVLVGIGLSQTEKQPPVSVRGPNTDQQKKKTESKKGGSSTEHPQESATRSPSTKEQADSPAPQGQGAGKAKIAYPAKTEASQSVERDLARFTFWLVVVGAIQSAVLLLQFVALYHHGTLIRQSVDEMRQAVTAYEGYVGVALASNALTRESIEEARRSNSANETLMADSNRLTTEATKLTRESLVLTQRPKIIVRNVAVFGDDPDADLFQAPAGRPGTPIKGSIFLVNSGNTRGCVISIACEIFRAVLPMIPPYATSTGTAVDIELAPGNGTQWPFETTIPDTDPTEYRPLRDRSVPIYVLGRITYKDDLGNVRISGFCRQWDRARLRFRHLDPIDPDYEYED